jgi:hypothetical protein
MVTLIFFNAFSSRGVDELYQKRHGLNYLDE